MPLTSLIVWLLLIGLPTTLQAGSARMELAIFQDRAVQAEYWPGAVDEPAILILHGWLQTRDFPAVRRLAEGLAGEGFSVLTPSLSLGLDRRQQSLDCAAIHTHSMQQDVAELLAWTGWLSKRTGKPPILIGHGSGGVQLAALLEAHPDLAVDQLLLVSPSYFGEVQAADRFSAMRKRAHDALRRSDNALDVYALQFCNAYSTTAAAFLSYSHWDRDRMQQTVADGRMPVTVIFGDRDKDIDRDWLAALRDAGVRVHAVAGANHLLDLANASDLFDRVLHVIAGSRHG